MRINQLTETTTPAAGDQVPLGLSNQSDRRCSITNLATLIGQILGLSTLSNAMGTQYASPAVTATTVTIVPTVSGGSMWLILTPTGTMASQPFVLPGDGSTGGAIAADGQTVLITTTQILTATTFTAQGKSIVGAPTTLAAGGFCRFRYNAQNATWYRVG